MSVDISVSITEDVVDIIATPTVNIVNVTNSASIDPGLYDLSEFTNTSPNPFVRASGLSSYVPTSRTLTINGVTQDLSANRTFTISTGITIGSTAIASGVVGRVLFEGAGNVVQESSSLFWDATNNRLGIGTSTPTNDVSIYGDTNGVVRTRIENISTGTSASADIYIRNSVGGAAFQVIGTGNTVPSVTPNQVRLRADASVTNGFYIATGGANPIRLATNDTERLQINGSTGNVLIGTTTDAGFRLDVNGTARVQNTLTVTKGASNFFTFDAGANGSDLAIRFFKSGQIDVSLSSRNQVNIGAQQISFGLGLNGGFVATRLGVDSGVIAVGNTAGDSLCHIASSSGFSSYVSFRENGVSERGLLGFQNGTSYLQIRTNGATNMSNGTFSTAFFSTGNVGINTTTDDGFRLDVNGTARVQGVASVIHNSDNYTFGFTLRNNSSLNSALTGINLNNQGTSVGQFVYCASNYIDTPLQNTVLFSSVGLQKLAFVANASNTSTGGSDVYFKTRASNTNGLILFGNTQNVGINTTTDAGFRLDVNGTARVKGTGTTSATTAFTVQNSGGTTLMSVRDDSRIIMPIGGGGNVSIGSLNANTNAIDIRGYFSSGTNAGIYIENFNSGTIKTRLGEPFNGVVIDLTQTFSNGTRGGIGMIVTGTVNNTGSSVGDVAGYSFAPTITSLTGGSVLYAFNSTVGGAYINTSSRQASAILQADSTTQGFLPPRMTTTQKNAIASPAAGLMVYDTTLNVISYYNGSMWI